MKSYPSIPHIIKNGISIYAFNKIDGSNIRAEWNSSKGFLKFGTRTRLLGEDQGILNKSKDLILETHDKISYICKHNRWKDITLFYEFAGKKSSFGIHQEDDVHQVYLIDANPYKAGILNPKEFINCFSDVNIAECLYHGICDSDFVNNVNSGNIKGMSEEGVVCKAKGKGNTITMFKIKRQSWYDRLKLHCNGDEELYNRMR
jgi:hypothetical protein